MSEYSIIWFHAMWIKERFKGEFGEYKCSTKDLRVTTKATFSNLLLTLFNVKPTYFKNSTSIILMKVSIENILLNLFSPCAVFPHSVYHGVLADHPGEVFL